MDSIVVYMTAPNVDEAKSLGRALLAEKLAACVNLFSSMTSIYVWDDEVCEDNEVAMIVKTRASKFESLVEFVKMKHSYSVPCVLKLEVTGGNSDYLKWLTEQC